MLKWEQKTGICVKSLVVAEPENWTFEQFKKNGINCCPELLLKKISFSILKWSRHKKRSYRVSSFLYDNLNFFSQNIWWCLKAYKGVCEAWHKEYGTCSCSIGKGIITPRQSNQEIKHFSLQLGKLLRAAQPHSYAPGIPTEAKSRPDPKFILLTFVLSSHL